MKSRILASLFTATAIFGGTFVAAHAQCPDVLCLPNGTPVTCTVDASGTKVWVDATGTTYGGGTSGTGNFTVTQCACGNTSIDLSPTGLNITSNAGPLGQITTSIDPAAIAAGIAPIATFRSRQPNAQFPAVEDFAFPVQATSSAQPGRIFRGTTLLRFHSDNVTSFNPHRREPFRLVAPVDFVDDAGNVVFSLRAANITLN
jgi:hypothetical protein